MSKQFKTKKYAILAFIGLLGIVLTFVVSNILPPGPNDVVIRCGDIITSDCVTNAPMESDDQRIIDFLIVAVLYISAALLFVSLLIFLILSVLNLMRRKGISNA